MNCLNPVVNSFLLKKFHFLANFAEMKKALVERHTQRIVDNVMGVINQMQEELIATVAAPAPAPLEPNQENVAIGETDPNDDADVVFVGNSGAHRTVEIVRTKCPYCSTYFALDAVSSIQCGHLYCAPCIARIEKCSLCAEPKGDAPVRRVYLNQPTSQ